MKAEVIFAKHGDLVRKLLAKEAKAKPETITDEQVNAQIAKGWIFNGEYPMCLSCGKWIADTVEDMGKMKKLECRICPMKFTL